jgi:hypothetical protein
MLVAALLGTMLVTHVPQTYGRARFLPTPAPLPSRSDVPAGTGRMDMFDGTAQADRALQNRGAPGRWVVLTGIIAYTDPKLGFVMIGTSVQNTSLARPGQQLPDGAWVREIHLKDVVLEYGGRLETVGLYEHEHLGGTAYAPYIPLPQQARWEAAELKETLGGDITPVHEPRSTESPPGEPRTGNTRRGEGPVNLVRHFGALLIDAPPGDEPPEQAQPQAPPAPVAQDPADELSDGRRVRAESRGK